MFYLRQACYYEWAYDKPLALFLHYLMLHNFVNKYFLLVWVLISLEKIINETPIVFSGNE